MAAFDQNAFSILAFSPNAFDFGATTTTTADVVTGILEWPMRVTLQPTYNAFTMRFSRNIDINHIGLADPTFVAFTADIRDHAVFDTKIPLTYIAGKVRFPAYG